MIYLINFITSLSFHLFSYGSDDIDDISCAFLGKYHIDTKKMSLDEALSDYKGIHISTKIAFRKYQIDNSLDNVLYVSWKELIGNGPDTLIPKLSGFTNIDKSDFPIDFLQNWRDKTKMGIEFIKSKLPK